MPRGRKPKNLVFEPEIQEEIAGGDQDIFPPEPTEKQKLEALYKELKDRGINSIGDLEVKISRL